MDAQATVSQPESAGLSRVNESQVRAVGALLHRHFDGTRPTPARWDDPRFWNIEASRADRCQFLAVGNAINFRFWELSGEELMPSIGTVGRQTLRGSMYMWRRLRLAVIQGEFVLDSSWLAKLTVQRFEAAFVDDDGRFPLRPGVEDRVRNLRDLGAKLRSSWQGQFANVIDAAHGSLDRFADLCQTFRAFDDPVQKLIMVNAIMLSGSGLAAFDREPLPGVDYHLIKQVVRQGLVEPEEVVAHKLATGALLDADESLSLRQAVLEALMSVGEEASLSTAVLDNLYWMNRGVCSDKNPACQSGVAECPFASACPKLIRYGLPLELTRYY